MGDESEFDLGATVRSLAPGLRVFDRFTLVRKLGRGGMGVVWLTHDGKLDLDVAVKFLPEVVGGDEAAVVELARETRRARELSHPNIVRVYDFHQDDRLAGISMEFIDGATLTGRRLKKPARVFEAEELVPWVRQLCLALEYSHDDARLVHRDLKPANLMVDARDRLKVSDFGISASVSDSVTRVSQVASSSGSPPYMSPQQMLGERPSPADDIYGLGATLFELLTGRPPFFTGNIVLQVQSKVPPTVTDRRRELDVAGAPIPHGWEDTIAACLAKLPHERPASAAEVWRRLDHSTIEDAPTVLSHRIPEKAVAAVVDEQPAPPEPEVKEPEPHVELPVLKKPGRAWRVAGIATLAVVVVGVIASWLAISLKKGDAPAVATEVIAPAVASTEAEPPEVRPQPEPIATETKTETETEAPTPMAPVAPAPREFVVTVDPRDAEARLWLGPRSDVALADGRVVLSDLPDGEHELTVTAPGFQSVTTQVQVTDGGGAIGVQLVPARGAISVKARPGTIVTAIDAQGHETPLGTVLDTGQLTQENVLPIGRYTVRLEHPESAPVLTEGVEVAEGRAVSLSPAQPSLDGELRIFSIPEGAEVRIAGAVVGHTPATLRDRPSGESFAVEIFHRGYRSATEEVTLRPGEVRTLDVGALVPEAGGIEFRFSGLDFGSIGAQVMVDGQEITPVRTSAGWRMDNLEVGARTVEIAHADIETWKETIEVRDGQRTSVDVTLSAKPGLVAFSSTPAGASVAVTDSTRRRAVFRTVAGEERTTPFRGRLAPGDYVVTFSLAGHTSVEKPVAVGPNSSTELSAVLENENDPEPGQPWIVPELGLHMVWIKPGHFEMGSKAGQSDESPVTEVTLSHGYWIGKYEVTQGEWQALMGNNPSNFTSLGALGPVERVSWTGAMEFCAKLTERERAAGRLPATLAYTLPTEAQWEYACRAGTTTAYSFGDEANRLHRFGNFADRNTSLEWRDESQDDGIGETTAVVGRYQPNAWGLYDMHGNVWEWCRDGYANTLPGGAISDPSPAPAGSDRVCRGGAWNNPTDFCRSSYRNAFTAERSTSSLGFRLALCSIP